MTKSRCFTLSLKPLVVAVSAALLLQGCAIPDIETRDASVAMPEQFTPETTETPVNINWEDWFNDPDLIALVDTALANNQEVAMMLQRINMAANEVYAREGEYLPQVSAGAEAGVEKAGEYTRDGAVEKQLAIREEREFPDPLANLRLGLNASWELDVWHKLRDASKVASLEYLASIESRKFFVTEMVAEVARTYYELLALDNHLANLDANIDIQQHVLNTLEQLKHYGRSSSLPLTRFAAEVNKNKSERYQVRQEIAATENKLNLLLGRPPQPIARNAERLMTASLTKPSAGVPSELLANRSDIREAELTLQAAKLNIDVARANFYPSFALKAGVGLESFDTRYLLDTPESVAWSLSGDIFAPLINRRAIEAEYKNASAEQIQAAYEYEYTVVRAVSEVSTRLSALDNLSNSYAAKQAQIEQLEASVNIANKLFASARGEYLEVLLARRESLEAKSELIDTRKEQFTALVELYQSLGGGWRS
ncbi:TolC family protein [Alteromonas sp. RKMC-009]|uniref:TolC family protein n=1 Tax=Alteromonas sp. RKMC-009 TaxID=2267264 RepID=UPI000E687D3E|nr:TolC family protein [Alteromonas sp. RKMC-009]AYA65519.1 TolC family protein [Alteromonas sp. RKMC-009]